MKKKLLSAMLALVMICTAVINVLPVSSASENDTEPEDKMAFTDVPDNHWGYDNILWGVKNGITSGTSATTFSPSGKLTRAMFVTFLARLADLLGYDVTPVRRDNPFDDVEYMDWYTKSAIWALENGIVTGTGGKHFSPTRNITRQETAVIIGRFLFDYLEMNCPAPANATFPDRGNIANWALSVVTALQTTGIFTGDTSGRFNPLAETDRASAITIIRRTASLLAQPALTDADGNAYSAETISRRFEKNFIDTFDAGIDTDYWTGEGTVKDGVLSLNAGESVTTAKKYEFTCGYLEIRARQKADGIGLLLESPDAADATMRVINLFSDAAENDGAFHTYSVYWLETNSYRFFVDGKEVKVIGDDYTEPTFAPASGYITLTGGAEIDSVSFYRFIDTTALTTYGTLKVGDKRLQDSEGNNIRLQGMHVFLNWESSNQYLNYETLRWLRDDWGVTCIRLSLSLEWRDDIAHNYIGGSDPAFPAKMEQLIRDSVRIITELGMYAILDWHILEETADGYRMGDPNIRKAEAIEFFGKFSKEFASNDNIFYELVNEPNCKWDGDIEDGYAASWASIKSYAEALIPVIRANDPDSIILVGTPGRDQQPMSAAANRIDSENIMYVVHFYAGVHGLGLRQQMQNAYNSNLPIFVTEYGNDDNPGDDPNETYLGYAQDRSFLRWLDLLDRCQTSNVYFQMIPGYITTEESASKLSHWTEDDLYEVGNYMRNRFRKNAGLSYDKTVVKDPEEYPDYTPGIGLLETDE